MHLLLYFRKSTCSSQYPTVVLYFPLKRLLSFPPFQWLTPLYPSRLSLSSVYLIFPNSLRATSTKGFSKWKTPTKEKINQPFCRKSHRQNEKWNHRQWSTQRENEIELPKESLASLPQMRCVWQGSQLPPLKGQSGHVATFQSLEKFSSNCVRRRYVQCQNDFRRWICLHDFLPGLGWDFFHLF